MGHATLGDAKRVYLAGPMSGIAQFNFPAFDSASMELRELGYDVVSPAELDAPEERAAALKSIDGDPSGQHSTWGSCLARDLELIADGGVEGIVVLPGWKASRGARLETFQARLLNLPIVEYPSLAKVQDRILQQAHGVEGTYYEDVALAPSRSEVRITDPKTGGAKGSKPAQEGALDPRSILAVAEVAGFGTQKYDRYNYLKGFNWSLSYDALQRHAKLFWDGQDYDEESGLHHMAHAGWQCLCLTSFSMRGLGTDDRVGAFLLEQAQVKPLTGAA